MKIKQSLAMILVIAMVLALSACGAKPAETVSEAPAETTPAETTPAEKSEVVEAPSEEIASEPIKLTAWAWDKNVDALQEAARMYSELTGVQIDLAIETIAKSDAENAVTVACESGVLDNLPDIYLGSDTGQSYKFAVTYDGLFYDLTPYVDWSQNAVAKAGYSSVGDVHYGIPFDSGAAIAMYRTDVLEKAGYTIADLTDITWDRFIEIGADVYAKTGYYLVANEGSIIIEMITSSGVKLFDENGAPVVENNEAVVAAMDAYKRAVDAKALYNSSDWNDYIASFTGGNVAAGVMNGAWIANNVNTAADQAGLWAATNIPNLGSIEGSTHATNNGGCSWYVFSKSENADAAAKFLAYMFAGEGMNEYVDFMTGTIGYITTYQPVVASGYYEKIADAFYGDGFWQTPAEAAATAAPFTNAVMYSSTVAAIKNAAQRVIDGEATDTVLAETQEELNFEFAG